MANPTGTIYLQANTSYVWTDGDIYQIPQTDTVEGAASGASFSGQGVDNQPHQVLLNKVQLVRKNQLTDETNIAALQTFKNLFTSLMAPNGYLKLGAQDVNLGQIAPIIQWGFVLWNLTLASDTAVAVTWPLAFPTACLWAAGDLARQATGAVNNDQTTVEVVSFGTSQGTFELNFLPGGTAAPTPYGFYWLAIGY